MQWSPQSLHSDESSCTTDTGIGSSVTGDDQPQPKEPETVPPPGRRATGQKVNGHRTPSKTW